MIRVLILENTYWHVFDPIEVYTKIGSTHHRPHYQHPYLPLWKQVLEMNMMYDDLKDAKQAIYISLGIICWRRIREGSNNLFYGIRP